MLSVKQEKQIAHHRVHVYSGNDRAISQMLTLRDGIAPGEIFPNMTELVEHYRVYPYAPGETLGDALEPGGADAPVVKDGLVEFETMHDPHEKEPGPPTPFYENKVFQAIALIILYFLVGLVYYTQVRSCTGRLSGACHMSLPFAVLGFAYFWTGLVSIGLVALSKPAELLVLGPPRWKAGISGSRSTFALS